MILIREDPDGDIDLRWHPTLRSFPVGKVRGSLLLRGCPLLRSLPEALDVVETLDLFGCCSLTRLPSTLWVGGDLSVEKTPATELPTTLEVGYHLWLRGSKVTHVPKSARIGCDVIGLGET